jgi:hypothetical protein
VFGSSISGKLRRTQKSDLTALPISVDELNFLDSKSQTAPNSFLYKAQESADFALGALDRRSLQGKEPFLSSTVKLLDNTLYKTSNKFVDDLSPGSFLYRVQVVADRVWESKITAGDIVSDKGFVSTSSNLGIVKRRYSSFSESELSRGSSSRASGQEIVFLIKVNKNTTALNISPYKFHSKVDPKNQMDLREFSSIEHVLPRETKFRVLGIHPPSTTLTFPESARIYAVLEPLPDDIHLRGGEIKDIFSGEVIPVENFSRDPSTFLNNK